MSAMKKKISFLLALIMLMSLIPVSASAASKDKLVAITFDDGPSKYTEKLLDGLKKRDAKCTFFIVGQNASSYSDTVKRMWEEGHEVASHTYDHSNLNKLSSSAISSTLSKTDAALDKALGFDLSYNLRPPYGNANSSVLKTVGTPCFYWSVDTRDWETRDADSVYKNIMRDTKDGSIVLLHDIYSTSVDGALRAIDSLKAKGYEFVTVSELFYRRGITLKSGVMYYNAYPDSKGTADGIKDPVISVKDTEKGKQVSISGDSRGSVYYTTNGKTPTPDNSKKYTGPFYIDAKSTICAVSAINWNGLRSDTVSKYIDYTPAVTPLFGHNGDKLSISCSTPGAKIYYTTDGSNPTEKSILYTGAFTAKKGTTYKACAFAKGYDPSTVAKIVCTDNGNFFEDIEPGAWYYDYVDRAVSEGLFKGMTANSFEPNTNLSRAMLVTILYRMAGSPSVSGLKEPFSDVNSKHWAYKEIIWGYNNEIIKGYPDGTFMPNKDISRQELCAMIARYAKLSGYPLETSKKAVSGFKDAGSIGKSFKDDVNALCAFGIIQGFEDNTIRPASNATRAQAATMILRFEDLMVAQEKKEKENSAENKNEAEAESNVTEAPAETEAVKTAETAAK